MVPASSRPSDRAQPLRMPAQVVFHKRRDEVITVVIAGLAPEQQGLTHGRARIFQEIRPQLIIEKFVCLTLVHQQQWRPVPSTDQLARIVRAPR